MSAFKFSAKLLSRAAELKPRPFFGLALEELISSDENIFFVSADSGRACSYDGLRSRFPDRVVECGICEQAAVGVAAGLSKRGKRPIYFAFAPFASERCFEQIRVDIAYAMSNVIIVGAESGVAAGTQGITHYGWEDMAVMRALPGMTVMQPADNLELLGCLNYALSTTGPVYIRLSGGKIPRPIYDSVPDLQGAPMKVLSRGKDVNILAAGFVLSEVLDACNLLKDAGIDAGAVDARIVKPLDETCLTGLSDCGLIVTAEEHSRLGGLGSAVAEFITDRALPCRLLRLGFPDSYPCRVSNSTVMMKQYGLDAQGIASSVLAVLRSKKSPDL